MARRSLPRFEVIMVNGRYYVYDYYSRVSHYPPDGRNKQAAFGLLDLLTERAKQANEVTTVIRDDNPNVKR